MNGEEFRHRVAMELASSQLEAAIRQARKGRTPGVDPKLKWRGSSQQWAPKLYPRAQAFMDQKDDVLRLVVDRDPCTRCGTRGDIGCKCG